VSGQVRDREVKLGEMLTSLIERGGYSRNRQSILDAVEVSAAALSQYSRNQTRPSFGKLLALADFFGVSLDYLVYGEPVGTPVDYGPLAHYVDHALAEVQARASRHSDLMTRIGRVLADRVDDVARELAESRTAGREGLIQHDEVLRVERYCLQADIVALNLGFDVIHISGSDSAAGQFLQVVAANLGRGTRYRFLLPSDYDDGAAVVTTFRDLLTGYVGGDQLHECCSFRRATEPVLAGSGLYRLDVQTMELEEPGLYTQFTKYIDTEDRLGYLMRPNNDSGADMLMSTGQTGRACSAFDALWASSISL
jgi:transcriptional regulator with XRE-family HTH domain